MPISIPTVLALKFVTNSPLNSRIQTLQNSYKLQYSLFGSSIH